MIDGGQIDAPELTIQEVREQILEAHHMEKGRRLLQDYDAVMDKVAEVEELDCLTALPRWKSWQIWLVQKKNAMPRSATQLDAGKRGMPMNFNHEELMLMMLYNTGTRLGLIHELRLMQCYLMPDETACGNCQRELSKS